MWSVCGPDKMHSKNKVQTKRCRLTDRRKILLSGSPFGEQILSSRCESDGQSPDEEKDFAGGSVDKQADQKIFVQWSRNDLVWSVSARMRKEEQCPDEKKIVAVLLTNRPQL